MGMSNAQRHRNAPLVNNVAVPMMNEFVGQISQGTPPNDTGVSNNQAGFMNGRSSSTGTTFPGNVARGPRWSDACDVPRVRFVDRIGTDQFIQQS